MRLDPRELGRGASHFRGAPLVVVRVEIMPAFVAAPLYEGGRPVVAVIPAAPVIDECIACPCGALVSGWFARAYRRKELKCGRSDPGLLCSKCAGSRDGNRIGAEIAAKP